ncbi:hypothetical protein DID75_02265 [Candidatus Marinamargulisbacteria bacterium SCGC AG-410-N11]|nr:hypothetical protein DID75_02265 [Candidatus Marinamargulisbacteria bacterium SCGC AG-410-N11]
MSCQYCKVDPCLDNLDFVLIKLLNCCSCTSAIENRSGNGYEMFKVLTTSYSKEEIFKAFDFASNVILR